MPTTVPGARAETARGRAHARSGYVAAAIVNAALLYVANNLLSWEWPPFLTEDFTRVLPLVNLSLGATVGVNLAFVAYDRRRFRSAGQIALNLISIAVVIHTLRVFPFDFTPYDFNWAAVARTVLILSIAAIGIAIAVEVVKLAIGRTDNNGRDRNSRA